MGLKDVEKTSMWASNVLVNTSSSRSSWSMISTTKFVQDKYLSWTSHVADCYCSGWEGREKEERKTYVDAFLHSVKFSDFFLPLRFYVKSISRIIKVQKLIYEFWHLEALKSYFNNFLQFFENRNFPKKSKYRVFKNANHGISWISWISKIYLKWMAVKSVILHTVLCKMGDRSKIRNFQCWRENRKCGRRRNLEIRLFAF